MLCVILLVEINESVGMSFDIPVPVISFLVILSLLACTAVINPFSLLTLQSESAYSIDGILHYWRNCINLCFLHSTHR